MTVQTAVYTARERSRIRYYSTRRQLAIDCIRPPATVKPKVRACRKEKHLEDLRLDARRAGSLPLVQRCQTL